MSFKQMEVKVKPADQIELKRKMNNYSESLFVDILQERTRTDAEKIAYTFLGEGVKDEETISYGRLDERARAIAAYLQARTSVGDRALIAHHPGLDYVECVLGCFYAGLVVVPAYPLHSKRTLPRFHSMIKSAESRVVLTSTSDMSIIKNVFEDIPESENITWVASDTISDDHQAQWTRPDFSDQSIAFLQYTSGSTSVPKGAIITHENLMANEEMITQALEHSPHTRSLGWQPLFHDMGLMGNVLQPLYAGFPGFLMSPITFLQNPYRWLQAITQHKITVSGGPNFAYDLCVKKVSQEQCETLDLSSWEVAFNGSETVRADTLQNFTRMFSSTGFNESAFVPCYGLTETTVWLSGRRGGPAVVDFNVNALEDNKVLPATNEEPGDRRSLVGCGNTRCDGEVIIVDPVSRAPCDDSSIGEIWAKGSHIARGYWNQEQVTSETFHAGLAGTHDNNWFRTGDLGFLHGDELFIAGRLKDMIIIRGRNYYPQDIELTVGQCHPEFIQNSTCAFSMDIEGQERLVIVQEVERTAIRKFRSELDVIANIRQSVAEHHEVEVYSILLTKPYAIPKTSSGKLQRQKCRDQYSAGEISIVSEWQMDLKEDRTSVISLQALLTQNDLRSISPEERLQCVVTYLQKRVAQLLGTDDPRFLDIDTPMQQLGVGSLMAIELQNEVQYLLNLNLPLAELLSTPTISHIAKVLSENIALAPAQIDDSNQSPDQNPNDPFPLNDLQLAYWAGRAGDFELGGVSTHVYMEFESYTIDIDRLNKAWQLLIEHHAMLRVTVLSDGTQQVLETVAPYKFQVESLAGLEATEIASRMETVRGRMSHQVIPIDHWPLFEICAHQLDDDGIRLYFSIDLFIADASSLFILLKDWAVLYQNLEASLHPHAYSFKEYVATERERKNSEIYQSSLKYWQDRIPCLPPAPQLPLAQSPATLQQSEHKFIRYKNEIDKATWSQLKVNARAQGLTESGILLAAYAETLTRYSANSDYCINVTNHNRYPFHSDVKGLVGQFALFTLLQVEGNDRNVPFLERANKLQKRMWDNMDHRHIGGPRILQELMREHGDTSRASMPVVFTCVLEDQTDMDWLGEYIYGISQTPQVWLDNQVFEKSGALVVHWDVVESLFPAGMIDDMFKHYCEILTRLAWSKDLWGHKNINNEIQYPFLTQDNTLPSAQVKSTALAHSMFTAEATKNPDRVAVITSTETITYGELNRRSNRVANLLQKESDCTNKLVAIVMEKGWEQIAAVLGILKSGAAFVPLNIQLPQESMKCLIDDCDCQYILTQSSIRNNVPCGKEHSVYCIDQLESFTSSEDEPIISRSPEEMVYMMYTSGSTGTPKGVMISHNAVVNTVQQTNHAFTIGSEDRFLAVTPLHHDLSMFDLFGPLSAGGAIVIPDADRTKDPAHWVDLVTQNGVTIWNSVPAMLEMLADYVDDVAGHALPDTLRLVITGGDWINTCLPDRLKAIFSQLEVVSVGGPTETTIWNIWYEIKDVDPTWKSIPYGKPIGNTNYYILNEDTLEACPVWVPGVLCSSGVGSAMGYWKNELETNKRFIEHPVNHNRIFVSGDYGYYRPDGNIVFLGREDDQVQINGVRIELGEIETHLSAHNAISDSVVKTFGEKGGIQRLVGYVIPQKGQNVSTSDLQTYLKTKLPSNMIPPDFVYLDKWPLSHSGKVDRKALQEPGAASAQVLPQPSARVENIEKAIADVVCEVLGDGAVSDYGADLTSLGANSIDLIRILNLFEKKFSFRPKVTEILNDASINSLASSYKEYRQSESIDSQSVNPRIDITVADTRPQSLAKIENIEKAIADVVCEVLGEGAVGDYGADLTSVGANSIDLIRILNLFEKKFGFRPKVTEILNDASIDSLASSYKEYCQSESIDYHSVDLPADSAVCTTASGREQEPTIDKGLNAVISSFKPISDPKQRNKFKQAGHSLRQDYWRSLVTLPTVSVNSKIPLVQVGRDSSWNFSAQTIALKDFSGFMHCLRTDKKGDVLYASRDELYPVQIYIFVKKDRVQGLSEGLYYYNPMDHDLVLISDDANIDRSIQSAGNANIYKDSAFAIFLIAQLGAIAPMYGEQSMQLVTLEAGRISQLLEMTAPGYSLGLSQVGDAAFQSVKAHFSLDDSHMYIHSLLGGVTGVDSTDKVPALQGVDDAVNYKQPGEGITAEAFKEAPLVEDKWAISTEELVKDAILAEHIQPGGSIAPNAEPPSNVLMTGATGFLGAYLLSSLIKQTDANVYCLVRTESVEVGKKRILDNLDSYSLLSDCDTSRIVVVPGDVSQPKLGVTDAQYQELSQVIDIIYHNAAWVCWIEAYSVLKNVNVTGIQEILGLACENKVKPVHYMSTMAIFPFDGKALFENDEIDHGQLLYGGYAQSKWVAEKIARIARSRGIPVSIYRPGLITGHSQTGVFKSNSYVEAMIKGSIQLSKAPTIDTIIDMAPVDYVSQAIVHLSLQPGKEQYVFHLTNPKPMHLKEVFGWVSDFGYPIDRLSYDEWTDELFACKNFHDNALFPFWTFLSDFGEELSIMAAHDCQNTIDGLRNSSIECDAVDDNLLQTYFSYYIDSGFLPAPREMARSL